MLQAPEEPAELPPEPPDRDAGEETCARAAFELPLNAAGQVVGASIRILAWENDSDDPYALVRLRARAIASRWEIPSEGVTGQPGETPESIVAHALLRLDCRVTASDTAVAAWGAFEARLQESLQVRRVALEQLARATGVDWSDQDLDCLWSDLKSLRRGPFLHDAVEGWENLESRLQVVQARDGGLWVCRAARHTHMGQFVFLDRERQILAVARYWLGE